MSFQGGNKSVFIHQPHSNLLPVENSVTNKYKNEKVKFSANIEIEKGQTERENKEEKILKKQQNHLRVLIKQSVLCT